MAYTEEKIKKEDLGLKVEPVRVSFEMLAMLQCESIADDGKMIHACSCSASCGTNYSKNGSCPCSSSCGNNYSKNGGCSCSSTCGSNYSR